MLNTYYTMLTKIHLHTLYTCCTLYIVQCTMYSVHSKYLLYTFHTGIGIKYTSCNTVTTVMGVNITKTRKYDVSTM